MAVRFMGQRHEKEHYVEKEWKEERRGEEGRGGIHERVGRDPRGDGKGRDTDTQAGEVVGDVVAVRLAGEGDFVFGLWNANRRRHVVGETTVLVEVDDQPVAQGTVSSHIHSREFSLTRQVK